MIREGCSLAGMQDSSNCEFDWGGGEGWGGTVRAEGKVCAMVSIWEVSFPSSSQRRSASLRICSRRVGYAKEDSVCTWFLLGKFM